MNAKQKAKAFYNEFKDRFKNVEKHEKHHHHGKALECCHILGREVLKVIPKDIPDNPQLIYWKEINEEIKKL